MDITEDVNESDSLCKPTRKTTTKTDHSNIREAESSRVLRKRPEPRIHESGRLECVECGKTLMNWNAYRVHTYKHHGCLLRASIRCCVEGCEQFCTTVFALTKHLEEVHEYCMQYFEQEFDTVAEFEEFLNFLANDRATVFSRPGGSKRGATTLIYHCHRSGFPKSYANAKRRRRMGSIKIGAYCPAHFVKTILPDGKILVRGQLRHVGHEVDMRLVPITRKLRSDIEQMLLAGCQIDEIPLKIRSEIVTDPNKRDYHVNANDVRLIAKRLAKKRPDYVLDGVAVDASMSSHVMHLDESSILLKEPVACMHSLVDQPLDSCEYCGESTCSYDDYIRNNVEPYGSPENKVAIMHEFMARDEADEAIDQGINRIGSAARRNQPQELSKSSRKLQEVFKDLIGSWNRINEAWRRCAKQQRTATDEAMLLEKASCLLRDSQSLQSTLERASKQCTQSTIQRNSRSAFHILYDVTNQN